MATTLIKSRCDGEPSAAASTHQASDRLHALDAVRAFALLAGIALHAASPFVAGLPWMTVEASSDTLAVLWYVIHNFRMPLFFLIAGFFGRMMIERRGTGGFVRDRAKRIFVPLVCGLPVVFAVTGLAMFLGALAAGMDFQAIQPPETGPTPMAGETPSIIRRINLIHLWFLYYLLIFYAAALLVRFVVANLSVCRYGLLPAVDKVIGFIMRGIWGPVLLALPFVVYFTGRVYWSSWGGLPAPLSLIPHTGALIGYGMFFGFGWLLHRQPQWFTLLESRWATYTVLAVVFTVTCLAIGGPTPRWGPYLKDVELVAYTLSYGVAAWCWSFAVIGIALRFLSGYSPTWRYLADSSYWLYLMHIAALVFFSQIMQQLSWHWSLEYMLTLVGATAILLLSYHYLVRFTVIGAMLNGRRLRKGAVSVSRDSGGDVTDLFSEKASGKVSKAAH